MFRHAVRVLSLLVFFVLSFPVTAAVFTVDDTADAVDAFPGNGICATAGNVCTLRAAIQEANALAGDDTINVPAGTYTLTLAGAGENVAATGDLDVTANVTIDGAGIGTTIVEAGASAATGIDRVFDIRDGSTVTISDLTMRHGNSGGSGGGGMFVDADLTMQRVEVTDNLAATNLAGGIELEASATLTMSDSIVANNTAIAAGGIEVGNATASITNTTFRGNTSTTGTGAALWSRDGGILTVQNCTFTGNSSAQAGAAIMAGASDADNAYVSVENCTFSGNSGLSAINTRAGTRIVVSNATIASNTVSSAALNITGDSDVRNTILAYNSGNNCGGTPSSEGNNLSDDASCVAFLNAAGDVHDVDPLLGPLASNGGPTQTHALAEGSPALDSYLINCLPTDQRGVARPQGAQCDKGAFELEIVGIPGTLQFQSAAYAVIEGVPSIVVTVERTGGSDGEVTVEFDTDDGTAFAPGDYATQSGTLTFPDGVTTQQIAIPIVNDGAAEGNETFTVRIFNPTGGATLGAIATTTVTISDAAAIAAVPTLSQWAVAALAVMLALIALRKA